jgi:iron complex transport system ATP-binding protein
MLEARDVTLNYGARCAVRGISVSAAAGEIVAILGPNGAGKSTLLRALNGGLKPQSGSVLLDGTQLRTLSRRFIARHIAVVAQETDVRFPVTVLEFVIGGRYSQSATGTWGWESDHDLEVTQKVLHETELDELQRRMMNELSGGERQRAILARALVTEARILLLDEPTANLDLAHQAALLALVRRRCDEGQTSAFVVTHDVNLAAEFSDYVLLMKQGDGVAFGTPREVLSPESLRTVFSVDVLVDAHPISGVPRITPVHESRRST